MGLSSSQGRLLSITARLTSNEYESQQISNAKMRLATQSQQASTDYITALNAKQLQYMTYDAKGNATTERLTAGAMYQYTDMKNQYVIENTSGQALISRQDAYNFERANNLDEFLEAYGVKKQWKSTTLEANYEKLQSEDFKTRKQAWDAARKQVENSMFNANGEIDASGSINAMTQWETEKLSASKAYFEDLAKYEDAVLKSNNGIDVDLKPYLDNVSKSKARYTSCATYDNWLSARASYEFAGTESRDYGNGISETLYNYDFNKVSDVCTNMAEYDDVVAEFMAEAEDFGPNFEDLYTYDDAKKAQWYTNLWYRLNGEDSQKSLQGKNKQNYQELDSKLLASDSWLQDAIVQGVITIQIAKNEDVPAKFDAANPSYVQLAGIQWNSTIFTSCTDITQKDDNQAIARAEADYKRKTEEINAKDEKYQNKIKMLDTEHTALQTEYESVQSAMNKNIERSFKAFS